MKSSSALADEMLAHKEQMVAEVMEKREEILQAFIAKHGFEPDECEQITYGNSWRVVKVEPEEVRKWQRTIAVGRAKRRPLSWWQKLCLEMAGLGK